LRFEITARFKSEYRRLSVVEKEAFQIAAREFSKACDQVVANRRIEWPQRLRVKAVQGAPGVWEMTWSFSGPDGRATWEWITIDVTKGGATKAEPAVRWRRIGGHRIFAET
jgi:hypothetical protein